MALTQFDPKTALNLVDLEEGNLGSALGRVEQSMAGGAKLKTWVGLPLA